jgi:membrane associated rhomboid family serine protease
MIEQLEKRFGRYGIPGLIRYVVLFNALVYVLQLVAPGYTAALALLPELVWQGEIWRLFTWVFLPRTLSPLWIFFALLFLWFLGDMLESSWNSFRVTLFYVCGWFLTTLAVMILPGAGLGPGANLFLNLTVLFAVATLQPNYQIMFFFVIPLKLKWLGIISAIFPVLLFFGLPFGGKVALILSFANYLLFFGPPFVREWKAGRQAESRRARFQASLDGQDTVHRCAACGKTEVSHPEAEFRVSADGQEYCLEHLPEKQNGQRPNP